MSPMTIEHECTEQELTIQSHMEGGEWNSINELRADAQSQVVEVDFENTEWPPPPTLVEEFDIDYANAWAHYQDEHEAPEEDRETNTGKKVKDDNEHAVKKLKEKEDKENPPKIEHHDEDVEE